MPDDFIIVSGSKVAPSRGGQSRVLRARILYLFVLKNPVLRSLLSVAYPESRSLAYPESRRLAYLDRVRVGWLSQNH